jgi:hypothetical protein
MSAISGVVQKYPGSCASASIGLYLCHKYFQKKNRPTDAAISPEAKIARWTEIVQGNHSVYEKLKLLISFIDDFYIFCRNRKVVVIKKIIKPDGTIKEVITDKKLVTAGKGPIAFLYYNVFDTLEKDVKKFGVLVTTLIALDAILAGNLAHLLVTGAKIIDGKMIQPGPITGQK